MFKSQEIVGGNEYFKIYSLINDSIKNWENNELEYYYTSDLMYQVDSLLCFNRRGDKLIFALLRQRYHNNSTQDAIWYMYGAKVEGEWLFWDGASVVLIRERYQEDIHTPIPFPKMRDLATKYISGYLRENADGQWTVDERFFDGFDQRNDINGTTYGGCPDCKDEIEFYKYCVALKWAKQR